MCRDNDLEESKLHAAAKHAERLVGKPVQVKIDTESFFDPRDEPLVDVVLRIRNLPLADASGNVAEVLDDVASAIRAMQETEQKRAKERAAAARAEMDARRSAADAKLAAGIQ